MNKKYAIFMCLFVVSAMAKIGGHIRTPEYLRIHGFQQCLEREARGSAMFWCMPRQQPEDCQASAWQQLLELPLSERPADCRHPSRHP